MSPITDTRREWTTFDKSEWGDGPWRNEPDKVSWIDRATGFDCLMVRNQKGALCGYAGVPPVHPWHGVHYQSCTQTESCGEAWCNHTPDSRVEVHGGLTYSDLCADTDDESEGICHVPAPGRPENVWWFGFDCGHYLDLVPLIDIPRAMLGDRQAYRDLPYVEGEVTRLAAQLAHHDRLMQIGGA